LNLHISDLTPYTATLVDAFPASLTEVGDLSLPLGLLILTESDARSLGVRNGKQAHSSTLFDFDFSSLFPQVSWRDDRDRILGYVLKLE
jgi:hypothetical protein